MKADAWRTLDDAHNDAPALDPPDADRVYAYLETCRHLGVEPVARERAGDLLRIDATS